MEIYVKSSGVSPEHDYIWKKIGDGSQEIRNLDYPPVDQGFNELLESKAPSLLLARDGKKLLLLVADLASTRKDYQGRLIRNSVAWVAENSDESELRKLAVRALESFAKKEKLLEGAIDDAIKSDPEKGFLAKKEALKVDSLVTGVKGVKVENDCRDSKLKIAKADLLSELIDELKEFKLPNLQGALIVYTRNKGESALKNAGVWRGLSSLVKVEGWKVYEQPQPIPKSPVENVIDSVWKLVDDIKGSLRNQAMVMVAIVFLLPAIAAILVFLDNHPPTISGTPAEVVKVGDNYNFTPTAEDKDKDPIEFSIENKPTWATFDEKTGQLSGQPTDADVGITSDIVISVSDGKKTASLPPFALTVKFNHPPTISGTPVGVVKVGDSYSFTPPVEDKDGDPMKFSIENKPTWATFNENTGQLSGQPTDADVGTTFNIVIRVSDGKKTASLPPFALTVEKGIAN